MRYKTIDIIPFEKAYQTVMNSVIHTGVEVVSFTDSLNRVLAQGINSDLDMPPFNKSTVDGFACRKDDLDNELEIVETIAAGKYPEKAINSNQSARIMTGAAVPKGADTVFMVEDSELTESGKVKFTGTFYKNNISYKGEDIKDGDPVLNSGKLIAPQDIAVMAAVGCTEVSVSRMPIVSVISSGDELVEPHLKPGIASIRNSNAYQLMAQLQRTGAVGRYLGIAPDNEAAAFEIISKALSESDVVLITGGVSMGDFDFIPSVLEKCGVNILFSRVNVQPGKPTTFGLHKDAVVFGLPGNPVSSFIQFELLVRPMIYNMMNCAWIPVTMDLPMKENYMRKSAFRHSLVPVHITEDRLVVPVDYHGSGHLAAISMADGIINLPTGKKYVEKGEVVSVRQI